ncbi:MAG: hypothetical protein M3P95_05415, partial [Actinomycetota bacterium]|nr:hypothetical protein [Actinomycetota bacterium]
MSTPDEDGAGPPRLAVTLNALRDELADLGEGLASAREEVAALRAELRAAPVRTESGELVAAGPLPPVVPDERITALQTDVADLRSRLESAATTGEETADLVDGVAGQVEEVGARLDEVAAGLPGEIGQAVTAALNGLGDTLVARVRKEAVGPAFDKATDDAGRQLATRLGGLATEARDLLRSGVAELREASQEVSASAEMTLGVSRTATTELRERLERVGTALDGLTSGLRQDEAPAWLAELSSEVSRLLTETEAGVRGALVTTRDELLARSEEQHGQVRDVLVHLSSTDESILTGLDELRSGSEGALTAAVAELREAASGPLAEALAELRTAATGPLLAAVEDLRSTARGPLSEALTEMRA